MPQSPQKWEQALIFSMEILFWASHPGFFREWRAIAKNLDRWLHPVHKEQEVAEFNFQNDCL
jgi:hypothetical protein